MEVIHHIALSLPSIDETKVLGDLANYRSKEQIFSKPFVWKAVNQTSPTSWWNGICGSTQLSKIAAAVLNLPPTSAAVERSFSRHSFIHSAKRNRLTTERAAKLVFIAQNHCLLDEQDDLQNPIAGPSESSSLPVSNANEEIHYDLEDTQDIISVCSEVSLPNLDSDEEIEDCMYAASPASPEK